MGTAVEVLQDPRDPGHSEAATLGIVRAKALGAECVALLPGDCPLLDPSEVDAALGRMETGRVAVVPDRHGTGTNGLLMAPPDAIGPAFGPGSCERHLDRAGARRAGARSARTFRPSRSTSTPPPTSTCSASASRGSPRPHPPPRAYWPSCDLRSPGPGPAGDRAGRPARGRCWRRRPSPGTTRSWSSRRRSSRRPRGASATWRPSSSGGAGHGARGGARQGPSARRADPRRDRRGDPGGARCPDRRDDVRADLRERRNRLVERPGRGRRGAAAGGSRRLRPEPSGGDPQGLRAATRGRGRGLVRSSVAAWARRTSRSGAPGLRRWTTGAGAATAQAANSPRRDRDRRRGRRRRRASLATRPRASPPPSSPGSGATSRPTTAPERPRSGGPRTPTCSASQTDAARRRPRAAPRGDRRAPCSRRRAGTRSPRSGLRPRPLRRGAPRRRPW